MANEIAVTISQLRTEYMRATLDETEAPADPMDLFTRWFREATKADLPEPNAAVLATATAAGSPSARAVLVKDFGPQGFLFFSNYASRKGRELAENPRAALVFLWCDLERQVRIEGSVRQCARDESLRYFHSRPLGSQLAAAASPQSERVSSRVWLEARVHDATQKYAGKPVPLPDQWGGYVLTPSRIEFWQGRENRLHDRIEYLATGAAWAISRLAP